MWTPQKICAYLQWVHVIIQMLTWLCLARNCWNHPTKHTSIEVPLFLMSNKYTNHFLTLINVIKPTTADKKKEKKKKKPRVHYHSQKLCQIQACSVLINKQCSWCQCCPKMSAFYKFFTFEAIFKNLDFRCLHCAQKWFVDFKWRTKLDTDLKFEFKQGIL